MRRVWDWKLCRAEGSADMRKPTVVARWSVMEDAMVGNSLLSDVEENKTTLQRPNTDIARIRYV